jgi:hypothetical protein
MTTKGSAFNKKMDERMNKPPQEQESAFTGNIPKEQLQQLAAMGGKKSDVLSVISSKEIRVGAFVWTTVGLRVDGEINRADWEETGKLLRRLDISLQWLIGDLIVAGEELKYGDLVAIATMFDFEPGTIYNYAYVARKVEISLRSEVLSFGHHQVVAPLSPEEQRKWLKRAAEGDGNKPWPIAKLQYEINKENKLPAPKVTKIEKFWRQVDDIESAALRLDKANRQQMASRLRGIADKLEQD